MHMIQSVKPQHGQTLTRSACTYAGIALHVYGQMLLHLSFCCSARCTSFPFSTIEQSHQPATYKVSFVFDSFICTSPQDIHNDMRNKLALLARDDNYYLTYP